MSETLREEEGHDQVAQEEDAHDEPDQVLDTHSRSTAFRTINATRKNTQTMPR
jgi:hypothetical protein